MSYYDEVRAARPLLIAFLKTPQSTGLAVSRTAQQLLDNDESGSFLNAFSASKEALSDLIGWGTIVKLELTPWIAVAKTKPKSPSPSPPASSGRHSPF